MIFCILGPTCSGKSAVAEELSNYLNAKIVNFDAFQVYKELEIGTAKPTKKELESGKYYFYNIRHIDEIYDVSQYQREVRIFLDEHINENIIMVGGTGLYLKAALFDYRFEEEKPMPLDFLSDKTNEELFEELNKIDPLDASKIGVNNRKRLLRALYIFKEHKQSKTDITNNLKDNLLYKNVVFLALNPDRGSLYNSINKRVDIMFKNGLEDEVHNLFSFYDSNLRSLQAIGYKEFNNSDLSSDEIKELIKKNTRNYAKRQMTFFKHQFKDVKWFESGEEAIKYVKTNY